MSDTPMIFICCAESDEQIARRVHASLSKHGMRPWTASVDLMLGDRWDREISHAVQSAAILLVLVTRSWPEHSSYGRAESEDFYAREQIAFAIELAREPGADRRIIPVLVDGGSKSRLPYGLTRLVPVEIDNGIGPLLDGLDRILARGREVSAEVIPRVRPPRLGPADIKPIVMATIRRRLDRELLLSWIPDEIRAQLPIQRSYFDQITSDVTELVQQGTIDGQLLIAVWLRQAERLAGPFSEAKVFRAALDNVGG